MTSISVIRSCRAFNRTDDDLGLATERLVLRAAAVVQDSELGADGRPDHRVRFATVVLAGPVEQAAGIPAATGGSRPRQSSAASTSTRKPEGHIGSNQPRPKPESHIGSNQPRPKPEGHIGSNQPRPNGLSSATTSSVPTASGTGASAPTAPRTPPMTAPASGNAHTTTAACALRFSNGGSVRGSVRGSVGGSVRGGSVAPNTLIIKQQNDYIVRDFALGDLRLR